MGLVRIVFLAVALVAGVMSAAVRAQDNQPLTGPEIRTLIAGNTVKGPYYTEFFDADGSVRGIEQGQKYAGKWRIDSDRLCVDFPDHDYTNCAWVARQSGNDYAFMDGQFTNTRTVLAGNPENL